MERGLTACAHWPFWRQLHSARRVLLPIHQHNHWTIVLADPIGCKAELWDSLGDSDGTTSASITVLSWLQFAQQFPLCPAEGCWTMTIVNPGNSPLVTGQTDAAACGVFTLARATEYLFDLPHTFGQPQVAQLRNAIALALRNQSLPAPSASQTFPPWL